MKAAVIVFPGSNCDRDLAVALEQVTGRPPAMVWHKESDLPDGVDFIGIELDEYYLAEAVSRLKAALRLRRLAVKSTNPQIPNPK